MGLTTQVKMEYPFPPSVSSMRGDKEKVFEELRVSFQNMIESAEKSGELTQEETEQFISSMWVAIMRMYDCLIMIELTKKQPCLLIGLRTLLDQKTEGIR